VHNEGGKERDDDDGRAGYASKRKREIWGSEDGPDGILIRVPHDSCCLCCAMLRHITAPPSPPPPPSISLPPCAHLVTPPTSIAPFSFSLARDETDVRR